MKVGKSTDNYKPRNKGYIPGEYDVRSKQDAEIPQAEEQTNISTFLQQMSFRDLSFAQPITVQANPNVEATRSADPYAIVNRTNPVQDAKYNGVNNLAGNTLPQLLNNTNSQLLNVFDCAELSMLVNYLYMAIDNDDKNQAVNLQVGRSVDEALSKAYAETYIQLPFFTSTITSSSMSNVDSGNRTIALVWYQTMLQNLAAIPCKYNMLVSLEQHLKNMCYNRNVGALDDLFGLLRKNSFRAKVLACSNLIQGEYFDTDWQQQMNTLTMVPSRKSTSMSDPLLIINAIHKVPNIKIVELDQVEPTIDSDNYKDSSGKTVTDLIQSAIAYMSPHSVLKWARQYTEGTTSVTPTAYFNAIDSLLTSIKGIMNRFPSDVGIIRTALMVANRAGLNNWKQGIYFDTTKEMFYQPVYNKLCNDVFVCNMATANNMVLDPTTYRWKFATLWDKYTGIANFDKMSGGSFLIFSTRELPTSEDYTSSAYLVPKLFDIIDSSMSMINRIGYELAITYKTMTQLEVANNSVLSRLNPLNATITTRIPVVKLVGVSNNTQIASSAYQFLANVFGYGSIELTEGSYDYICNSDKVCFIDIELDDISNSVIAYCQAFSPFKVYAPIKTRQIGFAGV